MAQYDMGDITGAQGAQGLTGPTGADGNDGTSAYAAAVAAGYVGTESGFYAKLKATPDTKGGTAGYSIVRTETGSDWARVHFPSNNAYGDGT